MTTNTLILLAFVVGIPTALGHKGPYVYLTAGPRSWIGLPIRNARWSGAMCVSTSPQLSRPDSAIGLADPVGVGPGPRRAPHLRDRLGRAPCMAVERLAPQHRIA